MGKSVLENLINLPKTYISLLNDEKRQRLYIRNQLFPEIEEAKKTNDGSLDDNDFKKIEQYYGFGVPAILGESFCTLRGSMMTPKERKASTYQGAMTGLFDDFFDKRKISNNIIKQLVENPENIQAKTSNEKLFIHFYIRVLENADNEDLIKKTLKVIYYSQLESKKQKNPNLSNDEIKRITLKKGGHSLLFYRSAFFNPLQEGEYEALYNIGALMQLGNDIFDVYKDLKSKIYTLATKTINIDNLRKIFKSQMDKAFKLSMEMNYPEKRISKFLNKISLGICRCYACLDQLEELEKKTNNTFSPEHYKRKEMICNMKKLDNILKSILYYALYYF